jgi:hypothetical protein
VATSILGKFASSNQKALSSGFLLLGVFLASTLAALLSALLQSLESDWSWLFYIFSGLLALWSLFYFFLGKNCPPSQIEYVAPSIDDQEDRLSAVDSSNPSDESEALESTVLLQKGSAASQNIFYRIFTSPTVWAMMAGQYCSAFGFYLIVYWLPIYFHSVFMAELGGYYSCNSY